MSFSSGWQIRYHCNIIFSRIYLSIIVLPELIGLSFVRFLGVDFLERVLEIGSGRSIRLMVWDTAGQEEFDALTRAYYRGAHGAILAFSSSDLDSFEAVDSWRSKVCTDVPLYL